MAWKINVEGTINIVNVALSVGITKLSYISSIAALGRNTTSDIIDELQKSKIIVVEGTLYPLLNRLKAANHADYSWKESTQGPPRKYYTLTKEGKDHLKELHLSWIDVDKAVKKIINTKK